MNGRTVFPECDGPAIEPGIVVAGRYVLLRSRRSEPRPRWLARETQRNLLFSLQLMRPADGETAREPFESEMDEVSQLVHPQLVRVLDYGWDEGAGVLFAAEERVEGQSLAELLELETFSPERSIEIISQLLGLLEVVHEAGLVHGDLEPSQVLVRRSVGDDVEEVLLRGLGRARFLPYHLSQPDSRRGIAAEWVVGSPEYASPEQLRGEPHDARSDLYAAGVLLFRLLAGRAPFEAQEALDVAWLQRFTLPPPPSNYAAVNTDLESVCLKALSKTPELRYQTAGEMLTAVRAAEPPVREATPDGPAPPRQRPGLRARRASARSRMRTLPMQLPASVAAAIELPDSAAPRRARDASLWVALGLLACTLAGVVVVAASRLGIGREDAAEETATSTAMSAAASAATSVATEEPPAVAETFEPLAPIDAPPAPLPTPPTAEPVSLATTAAEATQSNARAALVAPVPRPSAPTSPLQPSAAKAKLPRGAMAPVAPVAPAARGALAKPPSPAKPAKLEPKPAQVEAKVHESKPQAPTPPETPPPVAAAVPEPAEPATPAIAAVEAVAVPDVPPPIDPPVAAVPAPEPLGPRVVHAGHDPGAPVTLSRDTQSQRGTVHVVLGRTDIDRGAVSTGSLREALNIPALERCYAGTAEFSGPQRLHAALEITTELSGRIAAAKLRGSLPRKFAECVEESVRFGRVRGVDTGAVHAVIDLYFQRIGGR